MQKFETGQYWPCRPKTIGGIIATAFYETHAVHYAASRVSAVFATEGFYTGPGGITGKMSCLAGGGFPDQPLINLL